MSNIEEIQEFNDIRSETDVKLEIKLQKILEKLLPTDLYYIASYCNGIGKIRFPATPSEQLKVEESIKQLKGAKLYKELQEEPFQTTVII